MRSTAATTASPNILANNGSRLPYQRWVPNSSSRPPAGIGPQGVSSDAKLTADLFPAKSCFGVAEMRVPAAIQLCAQGRIKEEGTLSGLVVEAVPQSDRQCQPLALRQLQEVRHGCPHDGSRLRAQRRQSSSWTKLRGGISRKEGLLLPDRCLPRFSTATTEAAPPDVTFLWVNHKQTDRQESEGGYL